MISQVSALVKLRSPETLLAGGSVLLFGKRYRFDALSVNSAEEIEGAGQRENFSEGVGQPHAGDAPHPGENPCEPAGCRSAGA